LPSSALEAFNACDSSAGSKKVKISSDAEIENDPSDKHIRCKNHEISIKLYCLTNFRGGGS